MQRSDRLSLQVLEEIAEAKVANKKRLAAYVKHHLNIDVDVNTMFDIQVRYE